MTDKELRRLGRKDLLQILISQMEENEKLKKELNELKNKMENRIIISQQAGSIAQAALQLNGVFEAAEKAAQDYLESIKSMERKMKMDVISESIRELTEQAEREIKE